MALSTTWKNLHPFATALAPKLTFDGQNPLHQLPCSQANWKSNYKIAKAIRVLVSKASGAKN